MWSFYTTIVSRISRKHGWEMKVLIRRQLSSEIPKPLFSHFPHEPVSPETSARREAVMNVFDRKAKLLQRERSAAASDAKVYQYLRSEIGYRVADRIKDVSRKFEIAVDVGSDRGHISPHVFSDMVGKFYQLDSCESVLRESQKSSEVETINVQHDEETPLPFSANSVDLVVSNLSFHWVNNLPGLFRNIQNVLKPDGCLIASMFGGETLFELRCSLQLAEQEREGGFAAHISPFTSVRDLGNLLNRAGFNLLTIDVDEIKVSFPSIFELLFDLRGMGENNAAWSRKLSVGRESLLAAASIYKENYGNKDGSIPATFQILYMIGWKPDPSQRKPAERGSGQVSIKEIGNLTAKHPKKST